MTEITFITSNPVKIAHARYLCEGYDVSILRYKKFFYGVGYHEPRIFDRDELLKESFNDAVTRWKKYVSNSGNRLFFIEDTSVRIDALSDSDKEIPGVDIKYWMQENTFESLDKQLKDRGNNRKVCVTSHVVLFLTDVLKKRLKTEVDFKMFTSSSEGSIVDQECSISPSILYPWLDNRSFNKWFVPKGFSAPISSLSIEDANQGDFRRGAFQEMLLFLKENDQICETPHAPFDLRLQFSDVFIVCGPTCSGKTTLGKYLVDKYGYYHIEASDFMTLHYFETHGTKFQIDKHVFAAEVLKTAPGFVVERVLRFLQMRGVYDRFVITGFRTKSEVESFLKAFRPTRTRIVFLNADMNIRYERWTRRRRERDTYSRERFEAIDSVQQGMGVGEILGLDGVAQFDNNRDGLTDYYTRFTGMFLSEEPDELMFNEKELYKADKISLEKAILITLALAYRDDEGAFFTTTEISKLINMHFKSISKNKNNISRYFNQEYHLYYEIKKEDNGKIKYKISPIGYSEAMLLLRNMCACI